MTFYEDLVKKLRAEGASEAEAGARALAALEEIKAVLREDGLDDPACFARIEQIVELYERLGSDGGNRHDFG